MNMNKYVIVDGTRFINSRMLIEDMVRVCLGYTDVNDIVVRQDESDLVSAFQELLKTQYCNTTFFDDFKRLYLKERFERRTLGV